MEKIFADIDKINNKMEYKRLIEYCTDKYNEICLQEKSTKLKKILSKHKTFGKYDYDVEVLEDTYETDDYHVRYSREIKIGNIIFCVAYNDGLYNMSIKYGDTEISWEDCELILETHIYDKVCDKIWDKIRTENKIKNKDKFVQFLTYILTDLIIKI